MGLNCVTLIGNLGSNPGLRYTQSGTPVITIRMATTESFMSRDNEVRVRTEWHGVIIWGKRGEALAKILVKGSQVCVEGRLQTRSGDTQDGTKRYSTEIVATNIVLLGKKVETAADAQQSEPPPAPADQDGFADDDIPF